MPRWKSYAASSGYNYQYQFASHQVIADADEYRFDVKEGRSRTFEIAIVIPKESVAAWEALEERNLESTWRYAVAKMALFRAFDDAAIPEKISATVIVSIESVREILKLLDI